MLRVERRETYACWGFSLGRWLRIHWHVGRPFDVSLSEPRVRLRECSLFGWLLPFRYYDD